MDGTSLPQLCTAIPGPRSIAYVERLARTECPAITARRARRVDETGVPQDPIVWTEARGANVADVDGNIYVDLTSAFGVCGLGHGHPAVVAAAHRQIDRLIHAMGDVYPSDVKIELCDRLVEITPPGLERSILGLSGSSSVESALKTAAVYTGKPGVVYFAGGYHGLSIGALAVQGYKDSFRAPFVEMLNPGVYRVIYPTPALQDALDASLDALRWVLTHHDDVGGVILEPIQGRGGNVVPPTGFLSAVRALCDEFGVVMILDEIYTGFGRTGRMFACEEEGVVPDVLCVGKAMGGGFPISAAIGTAQVMDAWGDSHGEALHTQTFLGNPLGCAMALAAIDELVREDWPAQVAARGAQFSERLRRRGFDVRGRGLMLGVELTDARTALDVTATCRQNGYLVLPCGVDGDVLGLTPPFVVTDEQFDAFGDVLENAVEKARHAG